MDIRIKEFLMMPYMSHVRKMLKHLILLELSMGPSRGRNASQVFQLRKGKTSPFLVDWSKGTHPFELSPPMSHRLKLVHYDTTYQHLIKWNDVHTLELQPETESDQEFNIEKALSRFNVSNYDNRRVIDYGVHPIGCSLDIVEGYTETNTTIVTVNVDTIADQSLKFTNPKYLRDKQPEKNLSAHLAKWEFSTTQYRNAILYLFEYLEQLTEVHFTESSMSDDMKVSYKELLVMLGIGVI